jgi:hypothetical protein
LATSWSASVLEGDRRSYINGFGTHEIAVVIILLLPQTDKSKPLIRMKHTSVCVYIKKITILFL